MIVMLEIICEKNLGIQYFKSVDDEHESISHRHEFTFKVEKQNFLLPQCVINFRLSVIIKGKTNKIIS